MLVFVHEVLYHTNIACKSSKLIVFHMKHVSDKIKKNMKFKKEQESVNKSEKKQESVNESEKKNVEIYKKVTTKVYNERQKFNCEKNDRTSHDKKMSSWYFSSFFES